MDLTHTWKAEIREEERRGGKEMARASIKVSQERRLLKRSSQYDPLGAVACVTSDG